MAHLRPSRASPSSRNAGERASNRMSASSRRSSREQVPGHDRDEADHHREGVMVEITGLQPAGLPRQIAGHRGDPVRPEPVDHRAVARLP